MDADSYDSDFESVAESIIEDIDDEVEEDVIEEKDAEPAIEDAASDGDDFEEPENVASEIGGDAGSDFQGSEIESEIEEKEEKETVADDIPDIPAIIMPPSVSVTISGITTTDAFKEEEEEESPTTIEPQILQKLPSPRSPRLKRMRHVGTQTLVADSGSSGDEQTGKRRKKKKGKGGRRKSPRKTGPRLEYAAYLWGSDPYKSGYAKLNPDVHSDTRVERYDDDDDLPAWLDGVDGIDAVVRRVLDRIGDHRADDVRIATKKRVKKLLSEHDVISLLEKAVEKDVGQ